MNLQHVRTQILLPAYRLLPPKMESTKASIMMLAIGLQESRFLHRKQINGPARGFWQFEKGGGVRGVMSHPASECYVHGICNELGVVPASMQHIYDTLAENDILAACFARLLLWTDWKALPAIGDAQAAWDCYERTWRPGKPHRHTWDALYQQAMDAVFGEGD